MSDSLDLKNIEKKAFRTAHQDGLWDIYIGGVVLCMSILVNSTAREDNPLVRFGLYLASIGVFYLIFWGGKKYLTTPRLGYVKFGPDRQKRKMMGRIVLASITFLLAIVLVGTILFWANPHWATSLGLSSSTRDRERLLVAVIGVLIVGPSMILMAYFNDFLRGYYIAIILSLAVFCLIWFDQPVYLIVAGLLILIPGIVLFARFLHQHPHPPVEASHE